MRADERIFFDYNGSLFDVRAIFQKPRSLVCLQAMKVGIVNHGIAANAYIIMNHDLLPTNDSRTADAYIVTNLESSSFGDNKITGLLATNGIIFSGVRDKQPTYLHIALQADVDNGSPLRDKVVCENNSI